ncbi:MAG: hypothetical protein ACRD88_17475 [Terriglobia bacterium]
MGFAIRAGRGNALIRPYSVRKRSLPAACSQQARKACRQWARSFLSPAMVQRLKMEALGRAGGSEIPGLGRSTAAARVRETQARAAALPLAG